MPTKFVILLCLLATLLTAAQERKVIQGRVTTGTQGIDDVLVVNQNAQAECRTDSLGNFSIKATTGDLLIFSDYKIETKKIRYTADLVHNGIVAITVKAAATELDEVVITRSTVNSKSLGLPQGKKYTPAERRLKTAGDFKPIHLLGLLAGSLAVDPILNAINGRTKRLKKELTIERRERLLLKFWENYTRQELTESYAIPELYIDGFAYYIVEDAEFADALQNGNKIKADTELAALAAEYTQAIADEK